MHVTVCTNVAILAVTNTGDTSKSDDISFLTDRSITDKAYFQQLQDLQDILEKIYRKDHADNKDIMFLNKLYALFNTNNPSVMDMIKSRTSGILRTSMTMQKGKDDLFKISRFLDICESLFYRSGLVGDKDMFREKASGQFRDHIRDGYYLQSFGLPNNRLGLDTYYQLTRAKVAEHFKVIPAEQRLNEIFWFSYSRMHLKTTEKTSNIDTVLKLRYGDCTDFTALNAFILTECNYMVDMPVVDPSGKNSHSFVMTYIVDSDVVDGYISRNEYHKVPRVIFDYDEMYVFDLSADMMENISRHMRCDTEKIEVYLKYSSLIEKGELSGFEP